MADSFRELIGKIITDCGLLELYVNNSIRALSRDSILFNEVIGSNIPRRIKVLRELLTRSGSLKPEIESLLAEILRIAESATLLLTIPSLLTYRV